MNNELWFNWAPHTNAPMANQSVALNVGKQNVNVNNTITKNNNNNWTNTGITCYGCVNGVAQGKSYIGLTSCPHGETTNPNPCNATSNLQDDCYDCTNQTMLRVARGTCLKSLVASPVDPVKNTSVNPCGTVTPVLGCMDPTASNYNTLATQDDGSCQFVNLDVQGCTDPTAQNYDSMATIDDGTCVFAPVPVLGCTDPIADNYNSVATQDDGSCSYPDLDLDEDIEDIDDEIKTAGLAGDNKMLMYIAIGIGVLILLK